MRGGKYEAVSFLTKTPTLKILCCLDTSSWLSEYRQLSRPREVSVTSPSNSYAEAGRRIGMVSHRVLALTPSHRGSGWVCITVAAPGHRDFGFKERLVRRPLVGL